MVVEGGKTLLQIGLYHVDAAADGSLNAGGVDFDAVAAAVFVAHQRGQQFAVAAAQIEYVRAGGDPVVNQL